MSSITTASVQPAIQAVASPKGQTVESFSLCLEGFEQVLQAEQPIEMVEAMLLERLKNPIRLLRWAMVRIEPHHEGPKFWCEGAYLKSCQ
jgi:hypothetical protein